MKQFATLTLNPAADAEAVSLAQGRSPEDALAYGVAAGTAAVMTPGTELCRCADVERIYEMIKRGASSTT